MLTPIYIGDSIDLPEIKFAGEFDPWQLASFLEAHASPEKGPYFCPVGREQGEMPSRSAANVDTVHALCLHSASGYPYADAVRVLRLAGMPCLLYKTFDDGIPVQGAAPVDRYHVMLPLFPPVRATRWHSIYADAARMVLPDAELNLECDSPAFAWPMPPRPEVELLHPDGEPLFLGGLRGIKG